METSIERQAIRTAITLAAVSVYGSSPEVVCDVREESMHLMVLCLHSSGVSGELVGWCDDAGALLNRMALSEALPSEQVLRASAAVLRLRLVATRHVLEAQKSHKKSTLESSEKKESVADIVQDPIKLPENTQKVFDYIKSHPDVRAKDLADNFSGIFSPRSTKRYTAELLALKIVRRRELDDGSVVYMVR